MATLRWEGRALILPLWSGHSVQSRSNYKVRCARLQLFNIQFRAESFTGIVRLAVDRQSEGKIELEQAGLILSEAEA